MTIELGRRLIAEGLVPSEEVEAALFVSIVRQMPLVQALVERLPHGMCRRFGAVPTRRDPFTGRARASRHPR